MTQGEFDLHQSTCVLDHLQVNQYSRDFSYSLAGTLLVQSNSVMVLGKTIALWIVTISHFVMDSHILSRCQECCQVV